MNPVRGIALKLTAVALFAVMVACVKGARETVPGGETVFFRSFLALLPVLTWAWYAGEIRQAIHTKNIRGHIWRGLVSATAMGLSFTALGLLPLPEVTAIGFSAPLMTVVMAVFLLGETVRIYRWSAVIVGFIGVMVMIWPRLGELSTVSGSEGFGVLVSLGAAFMMAFAVITVRLLARTEHTMTIVFYFHVSCSVAALATVPWGWVWPEPEVWAMLIGAGLFGGFGQIALTHSYRYADASTLAPFDYTMMLFSLVTGWFLFAEVPTLAVLIGAAIVIAAGLYILMRERKLGLSQPAPLRRNTP